MGKIKSHNKQKIQIMYDNESNDYYIIWQSTVIISSGKTEIEAVKDFKHTVHLYIHSLIDKKLKDISK